MGDDKEDDRNDNVSTNFVGFEKVDELDDSSDIDKDDNNDVKENYKVVQSRVLDLLEVDEDGEVININMIKDNKDKSNKTKGDDTVISDPREFCDVVNEYSINENIKRKMEEDTYTSDPEPINEEEKRNKE